MARNTNFSIVGCAATIRSIGLILVGGLVVLATRKRQNHVTQDS